MSEEHKASSEQIPEFERFKKDNELLTTIIDILLDSAIEKILDTPKHSINIINSIATMKIVKINKTIKGTDFSEEVSKNYLLKLIDIYKDLKLLEKMIDDTVKVDV